LPLNDVRDHEQVEKDQRRAAPPAGFRFANTGFAVAGDVASGSGSPGNPPCRFEFRTDATTFHRVAEFTAKTAISQQAARPSASCSKTKLRLELLSEAKHPATSND